MTLRLSFLALVFMLPGCSKPSANEPLSQDAAFKAVWDVPYVSQTCDRISQVDDPNVRPALIPQGEVNVDNVPFFDFQFAESHPTHLATIAWVRVNRLTGEVLFQDTAGDCAWLTPEVWLKRTHTTDTK